MQLGKMATQTDSLMNHVQALQKEKQRLQQQPAVAAPAAASVGASIELRSQLHVLLKERDALRKENEAYKTELSAFDVQFFDEIEELKYRYSETVKLLKQTQINNSALQTQLREKDAELRRLKGQPVHEHKE